MYKVLDVREYDDIDKGTNYHSGTIQIQKTHYLVAICEDTKTNKRVRFEFYSGKARAVLGNTYYDGYIGDYNLIAPGDIIMIEETTTFKKVVIVPNLLQEVKPYYDYR